MALTVSVSPISSTSIEVSWGYSAASDILPDSVSFNEYDAAGNLVQASGTLSPLANVIIFPGLKPKTTYYYQYCSTTSGPGGESTDCGLWNEYSGTTLDSSRPPPKTTIDYWRSSFPNPSSAVRGVVDTYR